MSQYAAASLRKSEVIFTFVDGRVMTKNVKLVTDGGFLTFRMHACELPPGIKHVVVLPDFARARIGDDGYFVMPNGELGTFRETNGERTVKTFMPMPVYGMKNPRATFVAIVTGMPYAYTLVTQAKDGRYSIYPRFELNGRPAYDDIVILFKMLTGDDADYSGMARVYRNYQLNRKVCVPLKERMKDRPELDYAASCIEIRIRNGWKPMPSPVAHQSRASEPPMKTAVTFDRVQDILHEFKRQGIERAEICLVGWNQKGHDGRFPEVFPVEEQLGGETKLRMLIREAQKLGYQIVCHSNSTDAYLIADTWDEEYLIKNPDGSSRKSNGPALSGGQECNICPQRAYERFTPKELRRIADLGFRGIHYIDVLTVVQPRECFDPRHPLNHNQAAVWVGKMLHEAKEIFGGSASEGGHDFCCGELDYALYASIVPPKPHPLVDRFVPFWQLVYHGIIMNNPFPTTCNYTIKDAAARLTMTEFGGRPFFYFYSNYRDNNDAWMGNEDLTCADDRELTASVAKIKEGYDEYTALSHLQTEFMEHHSEIAKNVFRIQYSNGEEIVCNYTSDAFDYRGQKILPMKFLLFRK